MKRNYTEVRTRGVSPRVAMELHNICKNLGVSVSDFLKPKLREIVDSYPEHMKKAPLPDDEE